MDIQLGGFFLFSHGWSWLFWSIPLLSGGDAWRYPNVLFIYLGGIGPLLGGIVMTALTQGRHGLWELWQRLIDFRRIRWQWYLVIFLITPAVTATAIAIDLPVDPSAPPWGLTLLLDRLAHPINLLLFIVSVFLLGPLPEEIGWRGYALDQLQRRWSALGSSLVLGIAWGIWHLPLFFMENYYQNFGGSPPNPAGFFYNIILSAILITWIYNNTRRSILAAVLFHFMLNLTGELLPVSEEGDVFKTVLTTCLVIAIVLGWGSRTLRR